MPRTSSASVVANAAAIPGHKLQPPAGLTDEERAEWMAVIDPLPAGFVLPEQSALLREYCRHVVFARRLADQVHRTLADIDRTAAEIDRLRAEDCQVPERQACLLDKLWHDARVTMSAHNSQTERMVAIATKLRITAQARMTNARAASQSRKTSVAPQPWNDWGQVRASGRSS